jgi:DNA polymerase elongation subunit (family B)
MTPAVAEPPPQVRPSLPPEPEPARRSESRGLPTLYLDIETQSLTEAELRDIEPKFKAPSGWIDPVKIERDVAEKKAKWYAGGAKDPLTGRVCAVGYAEDDNAPSLIILPDEADLLRRTWALLSDRTGHLRCRVCGWNLAAFDLPFLTRRSWKLGVDVPAGLRAGRFWSNYVVDAMEVWSLGVKGDTASLDDAAKFFGLGGKLGSGADFAALLVADRPAAERYLRQDIELTRAVHRRLVLR